MCKCSGQQSSLSEEGLVSERVFSAYANMDTQMALDVVHFYECHETLGHLIETYDKHHSRYTLATPIRYASGHRALIADGMIDAADPKPIILQQGVPTIIDWSDAKHVNTPVYVADQANTKTPCAPDIAAFVTIDMIAHRTTILVPSATANFQTLKIYYYYDDVNMLHPIAIIPVRPLVSANLRVRHDVFCSVQVLRSRLTMLCACDQNQGYTDP